MFQHLGQLDNLGQLDCFDLGSFFRRLAKFLGRLCAYFMSLALALALAKGDWPTDTSNGDRSAVAKRTRQSSVHHFAEFHAAKRHHRLHTFDVVIETREKGHGDLIGKDADDKFDRVVSEKGFQRGNNRVIIERANRAFRAQLSLCTASETGKPSAVSRLGAECHGKLINAHCTNRMKKETVQIEIE